MLRDLKNKAKIFLKEDKKRLFETYRAKVGVRLNNGRILGYYEGEEEPEGRALISYIVEPFLIDQESDRFYRHQNKWQALEIARALNRLGYAVDIYQFDDETVSPDEYEKYDLLFGQDPNFWRFSQRLPDDVLRIYYAPGKHWRQRNEALDRRMERLEERKGRRLEGRRSMRETRSEEIADALIIIGDEYTRRTYTERLEGTPSRTVRISSFDFLEPPAEKDFEAACRNFLWFGGGGLVLKGLDLILEVFKELDDQHLYICGPVVHHQDFSELYSEELYATKNIHTVGLVNIRSEKFKELTRKCGYVIHTSASESMPGGVATCMHRGLVPIVTKETMSEVDDDWGVLLGDSQLNTIRDAVVDASSIDPATLESTSRRANDFAKENFTRETFSQDFEEALKSVLEEVGAENDR